MTNPALPAGLSVHAIPAFTDNYIWCLTDEKHAVVVDPGDAQPVLEFCQHHQLSLAAILITHHHPDHIGGIAKLVSANPSIPVIGPRGGHIRGLTKSVTQGDTVHLTVLGCQFAVMEVPGHTLDHIAFYGHGLVFCGDTLFSAGCGRLFEGSAAQMSHSLNKLKRLPEQTLVYCTHEYTLANLAFARTVDPDNLTLEAYTEWANEARKQGIPTLPSTIKTELAINPFLRCQDPAISRAAQQHVNKTLMDETAVFGALRQWKDEF
ncbi:hydroxyacylglutathione hydrolase [Alteromonas aestuariivivens]|uniref:Hydroxyacylglutathione hydrolase n=1 Tax=Alteromonas aestuariivivens TaxID=1938339 RepID=A0A3D8M3U4_9ALTE|nr:hydroxyacylglutathione hydrolase [Alteromonas aestuariivivens]RDV24306.1 hydroxyacylglutathione hydrolase [Alteromonas aestuariivivens]